MTLQSRLQHCSLVQVTVGWRQRLGWDYLLSVTLGNVFAGWRMQVWVTDFQAVLVFKEAIWYSDFAQADGMHLWFLHLGHTSDWTQRYWEQHMLTCGSRPNAFTLNNTVVPSWSCFCPHHTLFLSTLNPFSQDRLASPFVACHVLVFDVVFFCVVNHTDIFQPFKITYRGLFPCRFSW